MSDDATEAMPHDTRYDIYPHLCEHCGVDIHTDKAGDWVDADGDPWHDEDAQGQGRHEPEPEADFIERVNGFLGITGPS